MRLSYGPGRQPACPDFCSACWCTASFRRPGRSGGSRTGVAGKAEWIPLSISSVLSRFVAYIRPRRTRANPFERPDQIHLLQADRTRGPGERTSEFAAGLETQDTRIATQLTPSVNAHRMGRMSDRPRKPPFPGRPRALSTPRSGPWGGDTGAQPRDQFGALRASLLYCPKCRQATPTRERLLLVLPSGNLYEYLCMECGTSTGSKTDSERSAIQLLRP